MVSEKSLVTSGLSRVLETCTSGSAPFSMELEL